jgi:hypothetical protein
VGAVPPAPASPSHKLARAPGLIHWCPAFRILPQNWQEYKLPFPWSAVLKERDAEATRQMQGPLAGFSSHSLNGPLGAADALAQRVAEDAARGPTLQRAGLDLSLLDEDARLAAAAGVAQCKACGVLARQLWEGLTAWVHQHRKVPNRMRIAAFAEDLCEYEVGAGGKRAAGQQGRRSMVPAGLALLTCRTAGTATRVLKPSGRTSMAAACHTGLHHVAAVCIAGGKTASQSAATVPNRATWLCTDGGTGSHTPVCRRGPPTPPPPIPNPTHPHPHPPPTLCTGHD